MIDSGDCNDETPGALRHAALNDISNFGKRSGLLPVEAAAWRKLQRQARVALRFNQPRERQGRQLEENAERTYHLCGACLLTIDDFFVFRRHGDRVGRCERCGWDGES
jgi:hypothetical protein